MMKRLKFIVTFCMAFVLFVFQQNLTYGEQLVFENVDYQRLDSIRVVADGDQIQFDVKPRIINGRTFVPMRAIFEKVGLAVKWDNSTQTAKGSNNENSITFTIGSNKAIVNNHEKCLNVPASIIGGRTMVPLRFLSENMGYNVVWVGESNLILMSKNDVVEWRHGGYETIEPYREYEVMYVNGEKMLQTRYTDNGNVRLIATINGKSITQTEYNKTLATYKNMVETQYGVSAWNTEMSEGQTIGQYYESGIVDNLILESILMDSAEKEGITISYEELQLQFETYKDNFATVEEYQQFLESNDMTEAYLKESIRKESVINKYLVIKIECLVPTYDELNQLFEENKMGQQVRASHILVNTEYEADVVKERLNNGESFEDVAKEVSTDTSSAENGGDLDFFSFAYMVEPFEDAAFSMEIGEISEPVKSKYGYHIIKVTDKRIDNTVTLESSKDSLIETYKSNKYNKLVENLKNSANIVLYNKN